MQYKNLGRVFLSSTSCIFIFQFCTFNCRFLLLHFIRLFTFCLTSTNFRRFLFYFSISWSFYFIAWTFLVSLLIYIPLVAWYISCTNIYLSLIFTSLIMLQSISHLCVQENSFIINIMILHTFPILVVCSVRFSVFFSFSKLHCFLRKTQYPSHNGCASTICPRGTVAKPYEKFLMILYWNRT